MISLKILGCYEICSLEYSNHVPGLRSSESFHGSSLTGSASGAAYLITDLE